MKLLSAVMRDHTLFDKITGKDILWGTRMIAALEEMLSSKGYILISDYKKNYIRYLLY